MMLEQLEIHMQSNESRQILHSPEKLTEHGLDLNIKHKAIECLRENLGQSQDDFRNSDDFLDITPKV